MAGQNDAGTSGRLMNEAKNYSEGIKETILQ